jgi:hypothetical protein
MTLFGHTDEARKREDSKQLQSARRGKKRRRGGGSPTPDGSFLLREVKDPAEEKGRSRSEEPERE